MVFQGNLRMSLPAFDLFSPAVLADPYSIYHRLRANSPVLWAEPIGSWILTRYDDVSAVLRDGHTFSSARFQSPVSQIDTPAGRKLASSRQHSMLSSDGAKHSRLRALVSKAFTPKTVENQRPTIQALVDGFLDTVAPSGKMDVMEDLAFPLPVTVIAAMLGVPVAERERFKTWSDAITILANPVTTVAPELIDAADKAYGELNEYLHGIVARLRLTPDTSLLAAMAAAEEEGQKLDETELYANAITLLNAGHETTTNLIGNGMYALLKNPEQLELLRTKPELLDNAVEELLRFDSPVQFTSRIATADVTIGGTEIKKGQSILCVLGAANRDPSHFPDPDRLDFTRPDLRHAAFGLGPHYCLGAPLARLEADVVFSTVLKRFPNIRLDGPPPVYRKNFNLRGLESLHVAL